MTHEVIRKKIIEFINIKEAAANKEIKIEDKPLLIISDDFCDFGFYQVTLSAPLNKVWSYFPIINFEEKFCTSYNGSKRYGKDEILIRAYFKNNGVRLKSINTDIFKIFNFDSNKVLGAYGDYWSIVVPCDIFDIFLKWIEKSLQVMMEYACPRDYIRYYKWSRGMFSELGMWETMWCSFKDESSQKTFRKIYGDVKYPTFMMLEEIGMYSGCLDDVRNMFFADRDKFLAGNSFRQTSIAFPYVEDSYEGADLIVKLIQKRAQCVKDFDIPHFYNSVKYGMWPGQISAIDQLRYLTKNSRFFAEELRHSLIELGEYQARMEERYSGLLEFSQE